VRPVSHPHAPAELTKNRDQAIDALFVAHHNRLLALARMIVDDLPTAEDIVQDAFASLYRRWPWIRDKSSAVFYLQTSVANGAKTDLRRRRITRSLPPDRAKLVPSPEAEVLTAETNRALEAAVARLPLRQRQVVVLRYYLEWSEREIAHALEISPGSVKQHASRAMASLSSQLEAVT
jgi:RNA polymerase sigma-70 factor (sigma-E family)